jgi:hypothetical protein
MSPLLILKKKNPLPETANISQDQLAADPKVYDLLDVEEPAQLSP